MDNATTPPASSTLFHLHSNESSDSEAQHFLLHKLPLVVSWTSVPDQAQEVDRKTLTIFLYILDNQKMKSCKKYLENIEQAFSCTQTMPFLAQNSLVYQKLQHN